MDFLDLLKDRESKMEFARHPYIKLNRKEKYLYCFGVAILALGSMKAIKETKAIFDSFLNCIGLSEDDRSNLIVDINNQFDTRTNQMLSMATKDKRMEYMLVADLLLISYHTLWSESICKRIISNYMDIFEFDQEEKEFLIEYVSMTKKGNTSGCESSYRLFIKQGYYISYEDILYINPIANMQDVYNGIELSKGEYFHIDKPTVVHNDIHVKNGSILHITNANVQLGGTIFVDGGELIVENSKITITRDNEFAVFEVIRAYNTKILNTVIDCGFYTNFLRQYEGNAYIEGCEVINSAKLPSIFFLGIDLSVNRCNFINCRSGGIRVVQEGFLKIYESNFTDCFAQQGGAIFVDNAKETDIKLCKFVRCSAKYVAGCIYFPYLKYKQLIEDISITDCKPEDSLIMNAYVY